MYIAAFVAAFNENIINVALHDIMAAFSVSATTAQWLVSGYMIVTSIFTAIMAFLSGRFSTRRLLFFACGCMVAGEVLCLVAPTFTVLLPSRILQAAGSGILFPLMMNVVLSCAPREKLGLYLSLGGACITLGPAFGPVISGLMCTLFGWRAVFVVPLVGGVVVPRRQQSSFEMLESARTLSLIFCRLLCLRPASRRLYIPLASSRPM